MDKNLCCNLFPMKLWDALKKPFIQDRTVQLAYKSALDGMYNSGNQSILTGLMSSSTTPRRGSKELLEAYKQLPWLRAVVDRISVSTASVQWKVMKEDTPAKRASNGQIEKATYLTEVENPFNILMDRPNPAMTGRTFRQAAQIYLELVGESFIIIERNNKGVPVELWPIPPTWGYVDTRLRAVYVSCLL